MVTAAAVLAALAAEAPKPLLLAAAFFTFVLAFSSENSLKLTGGRFWAPDRYSRDSLYLRAHTDSARQQRRQS